MMKLNRILVAAGALGFFLSSHERAFSASDLDLEKALACIKTINNAESSHSVESSTAAAGLAAGAKRLLLAGSGKEALVSLFAIEDQSEAGTWYLFTPKTAYKTKVSNLSEADSDLWKSGWDRVRKTLVGAIQGADNGEALQRLTLTIDSIVNQLGKSRLSEDQINRIKKKMLSQVASELPQYFKQPSVAQSTVVAGAAGSLAGEFVTKIEGIGQVRLFPQFTGNASDQETPAFRGLAIREGTREPEACDPPCFRLENSDKLGSDARRVMERNIVDQLASGWTSGARQLVDWKRGAALPERVQSLARSLDACQGLGLKVERERRRIQGELGAKTGLPKSGAVGAAAAGAN